MGVWSSSPGRVGVVIAAERKSPSYKRHSRVTESVWWSWLIARETTVRLQIDREGKGRVNVPWSRVLCGPGIGPGPVDHGRVFAL